MTNKKGGAAVNEKDELDGYFHHIDVPGLSQDLIIGAEEIATWLFGAPERRRLYHLAETSRLPTLRVGSKIAIQKSVIRASFWAQQSRSFANDNVEELIRLRLLLLKLLELLQPPELDTKLGRNIDYVQISFAMIEISRALKVLTSEPR